MALVSFLHAHGVSVRALDRSGVIRAATLRRWVRGESAPYFATVKRLADALGCTTGDVLAAVLLARRSRISGAAS